MREFHARKRNGRWCLVAISANDFDVVAENSTSAARVIAF
jgi:hypothetical protein